MTKTTSLLTAAATLAAAVVLPGGAAAQSPNNSNAIGTGTATLVRPSAIGQRMGPSPGSAFHPRYQPYDFRAGWYGGMYNGYYFRVYQPVVLVVPDYTEQTQWAQPPSHRAPYGPNFPGAAAAAPGHHAHDAGPVVGPAVVGGNAMPLPANNGHVIAPNH